MSDGQLPSQVRAEQESPDPTADNQELTNQASGEPARPTATQERAESAAEKPAKGDRSGPEAARMQGHWLLAKLGKRILRPGGRALTAQLLAEAGPAASDDIVELGAKPLTLEGWTALLAEQGLVVEWHERAPLHLLEPRRIIDDEGLWGAFRFWRNARRTPGARDRLRAMRQGFQLQGRLMGGIAILARKPQ